MAEDHVGWGGEYRGIRIRIRVVVMSVGVWELGVGSLGTYCKITYRESGVRCTEGMDVDVGLISYSVRRLRHGNSLGRIL
jgi:hypothetical protein